MLKMNLPLKHHFFLCRTVGSAPHLINISLVGHIKSDGKTQPVNLSMVGHAPRTISLPRSLSIHSLSDH